MSGVRFDVELLDDDDPFEIDRQVTHLFKHPYLGLEDVVDMWVGEPLFYPAKPLAHWLMVAEVAGQILAAPLAPSNSGDRTRCRPIGCYIAAAPRESLQGGPMSTPMTPEQEHEYYADPDNQVPQGPPVRRRTRLSEPVPVRFPGELLELVRQRAAEDDRSVSSWIRRAVEHELGREAS